MKYYYFRRIKFLNRKKWTYCDLTVIRTKLFEYKYSNIKQNHSNSSNRFYGTVGTILHTNPVLTILLYCYKIQ